MHQVKFYPLGNAETVQIELENRQRILFDYADQRDPPNSQDLRIDLAQVLRDDLRAAQRDYFDVVAFSHLDNDHIQGATEFFHLDHAQKYQGEGRIKIDTLWVPAAAIIEEGCEDEARIMQAEARHRLGAGSGIRVFSRPRQLEEWLASQGLSLESRRHLITDAGQLAPEFTLAAHGIEFFVHSPFAHRLADGVVLDRNRDALVVQARFSYRNVITQLLLTADLPHQQLAEMVDVTRYYGNADRLEWDIIDIPHHCSYLSLSAEKGTDKTEPVPQLAWLYEEQAQERGLLISSSKPIPASDSDQPPHRQAANYYRGCAAAVDGEFLVTMEYPTAAAPEPLVITIDENKATVRKRTVGAIGIIGSRPAPRAG